MASMGNKVYYRPAKFHFSSEFSSSYSPALIIYAFRHAAVVTDVCVINNCSMQTHVIINYVELVTTITIGDSEK